MLEARKAASSKKDTNIKAITLSDEPDAKVSKYMYGSENSDNSSKIKPEI
jgi:hypothetical protein